MSSRDCSYFCLIVSDALCGYRWYRGERVQVASCMNTVNQVCERLVDIRAKYNSMSLIWWMITSTVGRLTERWRNPHGNSFLIEACFHNFTYCIFLFDRGYCAWHTVTWGMLVYLFVSTGQYRSFKIDPNQPPGFSHVVRHCYCKIQKGNIFVQNDSHKFHDLCC